MRLTDYTTLTFDCYGTLIDWETGIHNALKPWLDKHGLVMSQDEALELFARHESAQEHETPDMLYSELLSATLRRIGAELDLAVSDDEAAAVGNSVRDWPAFPDSARALAYLKQHYKLVILSNVDNESFAGSNERLQVEFDAIYTAQDVGSYKPSDRNFEYMLEALGRCGIDSHEILHTAESMFHDHVPAKRHGLTSCWIYRRHDQEGFGATMNPGELPDVAFRFNSMAELAKAHQAELAS